MDQGAETRLASDVRGTFTDVVLEFDGRRFARKVLTTPHAPELGVKTGVTRILADAGKPFVDVTVVVHGTLPATIAIIERQSLRTTLLATEGFRAVCDIATEGGTTSTTSPSASRCDCHLGRLEKMRRITM